MKTKQIHVPLEIDDMLKRQLQKIIDDCKALGIHPKKIPKTKVLKLLEKRINEYEQENKKTFLGLL